MKMSRPAMRRLVQVPDQRLLAQRQRVEAVRIELHHRGVVHRLEQVLALGAAAAGAGVEAAGAGASVAEPVEHPTPPLPQPAVRTAARTIAR